MGQAFTLRYIPAREDLNPIEVFRNPDHPQRAAVETVPPGHVLVMDCRGDASAASAGSILHKRMEVRGCAGLVTDGGLRDAELIAQSPMPAFCANPSAPTNLTKHQALDMNVPIGCGGAPVFPGDLVVGDGDGVVIVPLEIAPKRSLLSSRKWRPSRLMSSNRCPTARASSASIRRMRKPGRVTRRRNEAEGIEHHSIMPGHLTDVSGLPTRRWTPGSSPG